ncbi:unnamed protein product [Didymodactylos carnosus]|uniref:Anaphase-promoting complex subunit 4-like WD40 domain-containing protein n=1 Tax=Didymodactylos carnosus TaxID=1234261 RepID=A0A813PII4_9BILA|nr:unnamed protein product [Didymodactylos carnosus]CAF0793744.1 unnamed protein product [Didymodactylos carnosus]CAF3533361.1 unnamed protein product [Didymodactylos carnosus]CAF3576585.1 unnamed protein product [Didymodactylos carnosus]
MSSDVKIQKWIDRRFFLSTNEAASRLFCFNTSDGFMFGNIFLDNDNTFSCEEVETNHFGYNLSQICWLSNTVYRPSQKYISFISMPNTNGQSSVIFNSNTNGDQSLKWLDENMESTTSSIAYNPTQERIAISYLNSSIKIYNLSHNNCLHQYKFDNEIYNLDWNKIDSHLLLINQPDRLVVYDYQRKSISCTLSAKEKQKEYFADCIWKPLSSSMIIARCKNDLLVWDKRIGREPIRTEQLGQIGYYQNMKFSFHSNNILAAYNSTLKKIKIYDFRFMIMRQVESFCNESFLDYHWTTDAPALVVATHSGQLHWLDIDYRSEKKISFG